MQTDTPLAPPPPRAQPIVVPAHARAGSDTCVARCSFTFSDQMTEQLGGSSAADDLLNLNYNDFLVAFSNVSNFEHFCRLVTPYQI